MSPQGLVTVSTYLHIVMAMIPGRSVLQHGEIVSPRGTPGNGTLSHGHAIVVVVVVLAKTVPVDDTAFIVEAVGDMDDNRVSPACFDQGSGICAVEETTFSGKAIGVNRALGNVEVILSTVRLRIGTEVRARRTCLWIPVGA